MPTFFHYIILLALFSLPAVSFVQAGEKPLIFCSIGPHLDFCRQIGGQYLDTGLLLRPGQSPATFAPNPGLIRELSRARILFTVSLPFEKALIEKIKQFPRKPDIIDTQAGIRLRPIEPQPGPGSRHEHHHEGLDPHSWLDPKLALKQAEVMHAAIVRLDRAHQKEYDANFKTLKERFTAADKRLEDVLADLAGSPLLVYHPAYAYFARAYGLHQVALEIEGRQPGARELAEFIETARRNRARAIFVQPQFDQRSAEIIAAKVGCAVVALDPLAIDYFTNLEMIAQTVKNYLRNQER